MPQDTFESRRQKHTAAGGACCQRGNILLFILIGVIMFYVAFGIHMYVGPPMVRENSKELLSKYNSESGDPPAVSVAQRSGFRGPQEDRMVILSSAVPDKSVSSTIAADGIDDAVTAIVRCATSQGNLTIDVRGRWAPLGSEQFLKLVEAGMFTDLPFFRVCPRYITQFGPKFGGENFHLGRLQDDKSLWGVRDMNFGYVFFAGSGKNSRGNQMVVALCETKGCVQTTLGKADWEVPVGTIRREGFSALRGIAKSGFPYPKLEMASQAANAGGPDQHRINTDPSYLKQNYPDIEYWRECKIEKRNLYSARPLTVEFGEPFDVL